MRNFTTAYTFGFAAAICLVLSLAVASASIGLRPMQKANERRDLQSNILRAVGLPDVEPDQVEATYAESVEVIVIDPQGEVLSDVTLEQALDEKKRAKSEKRAPLMRPVYLRRDGDSIAAYAIPMDGKGLWGPISGYLALEPDGKTVLGTTFFAPKETPGLGYEITADVFTSQWPGKTVYEGGQAAPVRVVKGDPERLCKGQVDHCVQGVSGATITGDGVTAMVASAIRDYEPYLKRIRAGGGR